MNNQEIIESTSFWMKVKRITKLVFGTTIGFIVRNRDLWNRIFLSLLTLFCTLMISFVFIRLMPSTDIVDYANSIVAELKIPYEDAYRMAVEQLNYDPNENLVVAAARYIGGVFTGNLGKSINNPNLTVIGVLKTTFPWTIFLASVSLIIAFFIGTFFGAKAAYNFNKRSDKVFKAYATVSSCIPDFIIAILLLYLFSYTLPLFPSHSAYDIKYTPGLNFGFIFSCLYHATLPILTFAFVHIGGWGMSMRGCSLAVLGEDYISAAKARGIPSLVITKKYVQRNAMLPLITSFTVTFGYVLGGSPLVENVFAYPGIGVSYLQFVLKNDYFMAVGLMAFLSFLIITANFIADSIYSLVDPRVKRRS